MSDSEAGAGGAHWSVHPWKLLAVVMGAAFLVYLIENAAGLALPVIVNPPEHLKTILAACKYLMVLLIMVVLPLLVFLFGRAVWNAQHRHGLEAPSPWKAGAALWVGAAFLSAYAALAILPGRIVDVFLPTILNLLIMVAACLISMLYTGMLFPVFERRLGMVKGSLAISAAFALLALPQRFLSTLFNWVYLRMNPYPVGLTVPVGFTVFPSPEVIVMACAAAFAFAALRIALYLAASRRLPGAWLMYTAAYGFLLMLRSALTSALRGGIGFPAWASALCVELPLYILLSALCLGALAGFKRWKTREAFLADMRSLARKARSIQDDMDD